MEILILFILFCRQFFASFFQFDHYYEDRPYTSQDRGLRPCRALSLYKTGTFSFTFDDGAHPTQTALVLDDLKIYDVKATFFVLTELMNEEFFRLIKRMLNEGHLISSHGPDHGRAGDLFKEEWKLQTKKSFMDLAV